MEPKCRSAGLDPVELKTKIEQENFIATFKDLQSINSNPLQIYIGAALLDGKWTWIKSNAELGEEAFWLPNQPSNPLTEKCMTVMLHGNKSGFNDVPCTRLFSYFCQQTSYLNVTTLSEDCPVLVCPKCT